MVYDDASFVIYIITQNIMKTFHTDNVDLNNKVNEKKTRACIFSPFVDSYMFNDNGSECFL